MKKLKGTADYEVVRGIVIDILLGKEPVKPRYGSQNQPARQFDDLVYGAAQVLLRRNHSFEDMPMVSGDIRLDDSDTELIRDVFWDLFRQGFITLGTGNNDSWPHFRLSHHAAHTLNQASPYRFHNSASYIKLVKAEAPDISRDTEEYLDEAVQTYYAECILASCVLLGVAAEIEFERMIEAGAAGAHSGHFAKANKAGKIRTKITEFQKSFPALPQNIRDQAGEDFEMHMNATQSVLRVARNQAGHGSISRVPNREQMYVNLQMFVPFAGCVERLRKAL
jgi:hypothetical protein